MPFAEIVDQLTTAAKGKTFLGTEFLTWLWYVSETDKTRHALPAAASPTGKAEQFDLWIDDRLCLEARSGQSHTSVLKGGDPSHSREAAVALSTGKTVRECKIGINVQGIGEYSAILGCEDLAPRSLRLPDPSKEGGAGEASEIPVALRLQRLEVFLAVLDHLFQEFLALRTEPKWEPETLVAMRAWITRRDTVKKAGAHTAAELN